MSRLAPVALGKEEFFEYIRDRVTTKSEGEWIATWMIPGMLAGKDLMYYTFWLGLDQEKGLIVCEFYFKGIPDATGSVEVGAMTLPAFRHKGYMVDMVGQMVKIAKGVKEIRRLVAVVAEDNKYSQMVVRRNKFKQIASTLWHKNVK